MSVLFLDPCSENPDVNGKLPTFVWAAFVDDADYLAMCVENRTTGHSLG
jgi:hypothetical protein